MSQVLQKFNVILYVVIVGVVGLRVHRVGRPRIHGNAEEALCLGSFSVRSAILKQVVERIAVWIARGTVDAGWTGGVEAVGQLPSVIHPVAVGVPIVGFKFRKRPFNQVKLFQI